MHRVLIGRGLAPLPNGNAGECSPSGRMPGEPRRIALLQLPSPATGGAQLFALLPGGEGLLEVNRVRHEYGAWMVGEQLLADGNCYLCSPIDPAYVLLGLLDLKQQQEQQAGSPEWDRAKPAAPPRSSPASRASGKRGGGGGRCGGDGPSCMFQEASSLLCMDGWPGAAQLEGLAARALPLICDVRGAGEDHYYRLSDAKTLAWLRVKLEQTVSGLRQAAPGSVAGLDADGARAYALGFIGEYVSPRRLEQLAGSVGLQPTGTAAATPAVRSLAAPAQQTALGQPFDDAVQPKDKARRVDPRDEPRRKQEQGRAEAKAARLAKEAQGTHKISSFFSKRG